MIGSKEKIKQPNLPGNLVVLNTEKCELEGDGEVTFNVDYGLIKFRNVGEMNYKTNQNELSSSGVCLLNFPFDDGALKRIYEQIEQWPNLNPVDVTKTKYEKALVEFMGTEKSDKLIFRIELKRSVEKSARRNIEHFLLCRCEMDLESDRRNFLHGRTSWYCKYG
ncbi:MAG: hypothetical protein R2809_00755 [Flavobacteriales bacterium]